MNLWIFAMIEDFYHSQTALFFNTRTGNLSVTPVTSCHGTPQHAHTERATEKQKKRDIY